MINVFELRQAVSSVKQLYLELEEEDGMAGDLELSNHYGKLAQSFEHAEAELKDVRNVYLNRLNIKDLETVAPSLNFNDLETGLRRTAKRKQQMAHSLLAEAGALEDLREMLKTRATE